MRATITGKGIEVTEERYQTEEGLGFGIWTIYRNGEKVFQNRPNLKKNWPIPVISGTNKINSKSTAQRLIENHGELRVNKRFQKTLLSLI